LAFKEKAWTLKVFFLNFQAPEEGEGLWGNAEGYLYSHGLRLDMPRELAEGGALPGQVLEALPRSITVPLAQGEVQEGRRRNVKLTNLFFISI
jgi:hypothetical protein